MKKENPESAVLEANLRRTQTASYCTTMYRRSVTVMSKSNQIGFLFIRCKVGLVSPNQMIEMQMCAPVHTKTQ